jgi:hypothetical protein
MVKEILQEQPSENPAATQLDVPAEDATHPERDATPEA